jgi:hypothetical protein
VVLSRLHLDVIACRKDMMLTQLLNKIIPDELK